MIAKKDLIKINDYLWEIKGFRARFYASEKMLDEIFRDRSLQQLINVTSLPGIRGYALAMPDMHEGYGFPIGGVAAMDYETGVISPGGIGYDINCGVRLLRSDKNFEEIKNHIESLSQKLYQKIPSGVGRGGKLRLNNQELDEVLENGVQWAAQKGFGDEEDLKHIESEGKLKEARADAVFEHAKNRGRDQIGTMGAGNHFVEVDVVDGIFHEEQARILGLFKNQVVILIHTGSRGLGHQVATDYIKIMVRALSKYNIKIPDLELACAPFSSKEGQQYFSAMSAAANFAWLNRQMITWHVRKVWKELFGDEKLSLVYDVAHNIAKIEEHSINVKTQISNVKTKVIVHRKGATRAFPEQPVIIPGSMGTASYVLVGTEQAMKQSFGSTCHGAGRRMSRHAALRQVQGMQIKEELAHKGITIKTGSIKGLAEEAPLAYKDIDDVIEVVHNAGIAKKVARLRPIAVIKG
ncbi:RtcB family protein [Patescibacteria group bacterium]|nr:RtcB family protein [Patescibacteria group bacterium]